MKYLLDSNVWIALVRGKSSLVDARFRAKTAEICTATVINAELWYGCLRSAKPQVNRTAIDVLLAPFPVLPFDSAAAANFATIRDQLERRGEVIGPYDLQIAAIALACGCTLVTHNTKEFKRIAQLSIEDWEV
jgi:tRNA(fMet)-specific endonuclease VapC